VWDIDKNLKSETGHGTQKPVECYHQDSALFPFIAQLERAAGFARDDAAEEKLGKLRALIAPAARGDHEIELLAELLSLPNSAADRNLSPQLKREMLFEALLGQLETLARTQPVLMVFEDAHWIDPTSRALLDLMVERVRHLPVLLVVTFRPEFQAPWGGPPHVTTLTLNRVARYQQAKSYELRAATDLASLWALQGRRIGARELLTPVRGWFTEGFETADLKEAARFLSELD
jgi:hypothetical protein